jgi:hypothetical protein
MLDILQYGIVSRLLGGLDFPQAAVVTAWGVIIITMGDL